MNSKVLVLSALLLSLSACSLKQDPFHAQPDSVRKEGVPREKLKDPVGTRPDSFNITAESYYNFREGVEQTITIEARANVALKNYEISIANPEAFPGMKVTSTLGSNTEEGVVPAQLTITWTPPVEAGEPVREVNMALRVYAKVPKGEANAELSREQSLAIVVIKDTSVSPTITKIENLPSEMREGGMYLGKIYIDDTVGVDKPMKRPTIEVVYQTPGAAQLTPFMSFDDAKKVGNQWVIGVRVDLRSEITTSEFQTQIKFAARNSFGNLSVDKSLTVLVRTNLAMPVSSWENKQLVAFKVGQKNLYNFWLLDPKFEGALSWDVNTDLSKWPGVAKLDCKHLASPVTGSPDSQAFCQLEWDIPVDAIVTEENLQITVTNKSKLTNDTLSEKAVFKRTIAVTP